MHILRQHCVSTQVVSVAVMSEGWEVPQEYQYTEAWAPVRHDCVTLNTITLELMGIFVSVCESNS